MKIESKAHTRHFSYALSSYRSKMILERPNCFGRIQIILVGSKSFWLGPNHFGQVQIRFLLTNFYNLDLSKMIWTRPKQIGPVQNDWYSTKMIWTVQNHFGPIEGQGIIIFQLFHSEFFQESRRISNLLMLIFWFL